MFIRRSLAKAGLLLPPRSAHGAVDDFACDIRKANPTFQVSTVKKVYFARIAARHMFPVCCGMQMTAQATQSAFVLDRADAHDFAARKPFLKWAGNKNRVKHHIVPRLPKGKRLVEPFAGSCAISLASDFDSYLIADANAPVSEIILPKI